MSISLVISQSKKEVIPSSSNNEKINECLGGVTKWQVLVEETVTSSEANLADSAFLPPVSSCHSTAFDTQLLSDELTLKIRANSDVVHLIAVVIFPRWLWPHHPLFFILQLVPGPQGNFFVSFKIFYTVKLCHKKFSTCTKEGRETMVGGGAWETPCLAAPKPTTGALSPSKVHLFTHEGVQRQEGRWGSPGNLLLATVPGEPQYLTDWEDHCLGGWDTMWNARGEHFQIAQDSL